MSSILTENLVAQSKYLYLQSAGSDGSDGSAAGMHLRWDFLDKLGDNHLPKGNLAASGSAYYSTANFNKENDFVSIYKTEYNKNFPILVDLTSAPSEVIDTNIEKTWKYDNLQPNSYLPDVKRNVIVRFPDKLQYETVRKSIDPTTNPEAFLKQYNKLIEVEVEGQLMFATYLYMTELDENAQNETRIEAISPVTNGSSDNKLFVSARTKTTIESGYLCKETMELLLKEDNYDIEIDQLGSGTRKVMAENIKYVRFHGVNCYPTMLWLETYEDFILGKNYLDTWQSVADLSLSLDQTEVFKRLQDDANYYIDNLWPRYTDNYKVSVANYQARWFDTVDADGLPNKGLKSPIETYLELSMDPLNPTATTMPAPPADGDTFETDSDTDEDTDVDSLPLEQEFEFSYLDTLKITAIDFHIARMLGLGHIDSAVDPDLSKKYIYMAVYDTTKQLDPSLPSTVKHTFMTLPTGLKDYKLPYNPELQAITYGLRVPSGDNETILISDAKGYSKYGNSRAINLNLEPNDLVSSTLGDFFIPATEYSLADFTIPIMYGIKSKNVAGSSWMEISVDDDFKDHNNQSEVMPIVGDDNPIFVHLETDPGIHEYVIYGVNWFSRVSALSAPVQTDDTEFIPTETFMPPHKLAVQLIQKEELSVLTSSNEQAMLDALPDADKTLLRVSFDWNNVNYENYWKGTKAQFYFRTDALGAVGGLVKSIEELTNDELTSEDPTNDGLTKDELTKEVRWIRTRNRIIYGADKDKDGNLITISPIITVGNEPHYLQSLFQTEEGQFLVLDVKQSSALDEGPMFKLRCMSDTELIEADDSLFAAGSDELSDQNPQSTIISSFVFPKADSVFSVCENTSKPECWPLPLSQTIELTDLSSLNEGGNIYTEIEVFADNSTKVNKLGGLYQKAQIQEYKEYITHDGSGEQIITVTLDDNGPDYLPTGIYNIKFNTVQLPDHPQTNNDNTLFPKVNYNGGCVRIKATDNETIKILDVVEIKTTEATLELKVVDSSFDVDANGIPQGIYTPILDGENIDVNFHPSYRAYLTHDTGFIESTILPVPTTGVKYTYMACGAIDDSVSGHVKKSYLSNTAIIAAREILEPVIPGIPLGPTFASRPDFYGKANYTFDCNVGSGRDPYMLIFYRATDEIIIDTLYSKATAAQVRIDLATDRWIVDRWKDLMIMQFDGEIFKKYDEDPAYRLPNPDNTNFVIPDPQGKTNIHPFTASRNPGDTTAVAGTTAIFGHDISYKDVVYIAITTAFMPVTEQPILYKYLKTGTMQTSPKKPVIRNSNGDYLAPNAPGYDQAPMAVKYQSGGSNFVRFTDYTLDGTSNARYFYYGVEMVDTMKMSIPSAIMGPISMLNTNAPKAPEVRKFYTQVEDESNPGGVVFEINNYLPDDGVTHLQIFRTFDITKVQDIRNMTPLFKKEGVEQVLLTVGDKIIDTLQDTSLYTNTGFIPYSDSIFYRLVAYREVENEYGDPEFVPSHASSLMVATVLDTKNPEAPVLDSDPDPFVETNGYLLGFMLKWQQTVYKGIYHIYQMNKNGVWNKLGQQDSVVGDPSTFLVGDLQKHDADGNELFYTFKVVAQNSSGLMSLEEKMYTI